VIQMAERRPIEAPTIMPGGGFFKRTPRLRSTDFDRAASEYGTSRSSYDDLERFLLEQPVFDRDPIDRPSVTTGLTPLDRPDFSEGDLKLKFQDIFTKQREAEQAQEAARAKAISDLRAELAKETASAADAAAARRSELTESLEARIAEAREAASAEVADQGTVIGDLQTRIGSLTQDLGGISKTISEEQAKLSEELRESQKGAVDLVQGRIDSLTDELKGVSDSVGEEAAQTTDTLRSEREQIVNNLEAQIGTLKEQVETLPVDEIQSRINEIAEQSDNFVASASQERAQLASQIAALEEQGITREDLTAALQGVAGRDEFDILKQEYERTGQMFQDAIGQQTQRGERLGEQIAALQQAQLDPANIQQERQAAITTAIDPIQQQLQQIQGSIPEQIDIDALRQQITQEVLAGLPQPTTNVQAPAVSVGPGAGGMDPYGQGGGYSTLPTTEGAAEMMGARPDYSAALNMSDGMADQMGFIPGGSLQDQIDFANVQPATAAPSNIIVQPDPTGMGVALDQPVNVAIQKPATVPPVKTPVPAFPVLGFNRRRIR